MGLLQKTGGGDGKLTAQLKRLAHRKRLARLQRLRRDRQPSKADRRQHDDADQLIEHEAEADAFAADAVEPPPQQPLTDPRRRGISAAEVVQLLADIEQHRRAAEADAAILHHWLKRSTQLAKTWAKFTAVGGVSAADFKAFMRGTLRYRLSPSRQRHHLRLVSSRNPPPIRRRLSSGGNDAA